MSIAKLSLGVPDSEQQNPSDGDIETLGGAGESFRRRSCPGGTGPGTTTCAAARTRHTKASPIRPSSQTSMSLP